MRGYRVGIVNPKSPFGGRIRELLAERHLPVIELKLFETEITGEATLTHFEDEVVVTQPLDTDLLPKLDVLFLAGEDSDILNRVAVEASDANVLAIVEGATGLEAPVLAPGVRDPSKATERLVAVPRMASFLLGATLQRIVESLAVARSSATILVPSGARGDRGAKELHQQVVNILNFKAPPTEVFEEQIAFNVNIAAGAGVSSATLAETIAAEASRLADLDDVVTVSLVQVPVFHAYTLSLWVELETAAKEQAVAALFRDRPFTIDTARSAKTPSPVSIAESNRIHIGAIRAPAEVSRPGFWLWAVADTLAYDPALAAVEIAKEVLG